ncbi:hypothetical protein [Clostridium saccharoperbutylacetonicum]|uniref:hypothetical protein n=1 Tax=Clostridium saccharoperbutylacetonicum TaxID=36745 RepID=UPI00098407A5|nr:hypothetical protein [Clostridium saccharoperbutylacetonicum]AQR96238.1 autolysin [Clostridium saccharoperbutylacetonicum]NSB32111.1 hypothetical protein [Clostridium saccharoperbutylacetonicum]
MRNLKLIKIVVSSLIVTSVLSLNPIGANAEWKQDSNGYWNAEGNSWSVGWKEINGKWYYFKADGYMKTGWLQDRDKWYYLSTNGDMVKNTTIDGCNIGYDGVWIQPMNTNSSMSENDKKVTTVDDLINLLKEKGYKLEVKDVNAEFLPSTRKIITIGNEQIIVYAYNSNKEMEKDSANIDKDGFGYTITELWGEQKPKSASWSSYPHFYKKGNIIVQYVGKNEEVIFNLKSILGEQFAGIKDCSDLSLTEQDIREIAFNQLDSETQKKVKGTWKDSKISIETIKGGVRLDDESYFGKDAYCVEFILDVKYKPDNILVLVGMDNHKIIGYGLVD